MWLTRTPGVPNAPNELSGKDPLVRRHDKASLTQMCQKDPYGPTAEQNMVARRVLPIHLSRHVVWQIVFPFLDCTRTRTTNGDVEAHIVGQGCGDQVSCPVPQRIQFHDINSMFVGREPTMKRIEQQTIAALEDCVRSWLQWKAKIHTAVRGQTARDRVSENDAENERRAELPEVAPANARWMPPIRRAMPDSIRRDEHDSAQGDEYHGPEVDT